jgi:hypothetical protein
MRGWLRSPDSQRAASRRDRAMARAATTPRRLARHNSSPEAGRAGTLSILLGPDIVVGSLPLAAALAGVAPQAQCKDAKGRATGKKSLDLLKSFGRNGKKPNVGKLGTDIFKAESRFTKGFTKAEAALGCATTGDADTIEAKVEAFVADILVDLAGSSTVTSTSTTSTTSTSVPPPACNLSAPPACGGACPAGLTCGNVGLGECKCLPPGTPCGDAAFPACGGVCPTPVGGFCLPSVGSECACQ